MRRGRLGLIVFGVGVVGAQAGHLLAYQLRFGAAAQQLQSAGAHAYFPSLANTVLGIGAVTLVFGLLVIGLARVIGQKPDKDSAPPYVRLLAVLFTIQLACFGVQETTESLLAGVPASVPLVLVWGTVGQLPVAAAAALALRWILARFGPALASLRPPFAPAIQVVPSPLTLVALPAAPKPAYSLEAPSGSITRRGPPSF